MIGRVLRSVPTAGMVLLAGLACADEEADVRRSATAEPKTLEMNVELGDLKLADTNEGTALLNAGASETLTIARVGH